ncbi:hypothetical protein IWW36_002062 [Coemansia brasiliensis]|uniref:Uncharacterized protein n=1 Tax=Coemansia brasiliensis TaxID=2650707 RepID=A0A9W8ICR1_9FUNG|nr:hypothetical protein IWW36_002062 [Coemansia brasiliensis]
MSFVEYAQQVLQLAWSFLLFVHQQAFPLCGDLVERLSEQWGPAQTILSMVGPTILTYMIEVVVLYIAAQIFILVVRMFSSTLYRLLRFTLFVFIVCGGVLLGLYFYFTSTKAGQQQAQMSTNRFLFDQVMTLAGQLAPLWDSQMNDRGTRRPPPVNFQYQPPNYH